MIIDYDTTIENPEIATLEINSIEYDAVTSVEEVSDGNDCLKALQDCYDTSTEDSIVGWGAGFGAISALVNGAVLAYFIKQHKDGIGDVNINTKIGLCLGGVTTLFSGLGLILMGSGYGIESYECGTGLKKACTYSGG